MWFVLALNAAVLTAVRDVISKKSSSNFNTWIRSWTMVTSGLIILIPLQIMVGIPQIDSNFWKIILFLPFISIPATALYMKAIEVSPLSLSLPMLAFTPLFVMITSFFINHELPNSLGISGIICILSGIYLLYIKSDTRHILRPFKAMLEEKGSVYMLIVSILWGIGGSLDKLAISYSSPTFYLLMFSLITSICLLPLAYFSNKKQFFSLFSKQGLTLLVPVGIIDSLAVVSQFFSVSMTFAAYTIAIKRLSILFSLFLGWYFFKEPLKERLIPIVIIVFGIMLIVLS